jgi:catechol 2,3-dioxygenase-like lactoylglutathione lyase family enzyme
MLKVAGIDHVVIRTKDTAAMRRFYVELLGCAVEREVQDLGLIQLRAGANLIDLVPVDGALGRQGGAPPQEEGRNMDHLCLRLADFDLEAVRAELEAAGVEIGESAMRYGANGNGVSHIERDPDRNVVELRG